MPERWEVLPFYRLCMGNHTEVKTINGINSKCSRRVFFHIPHDGSSFPDELMKSVCIPEADFFAYHEEMRDCRVSAFVPEAFRNERNLIEFNVSRLLCDVERFTGPEEMMERFGMGFCYEKAYDGRRIKKVTFELNQATLSYYNEHHDRLDALMREYPRSLLIDLHSFSEKTLWSGFTPEGTIPDICIGTDDRYTPESFAAEAERVFREAGFTVARNYPYAGTMVPNAVYSGRIKRDLISVMIEINKSVYLDGRGNVAPDVQQRIQKAIKKLIAAVE